MIDDEENFYYEKFKKEWKKTVMALKESGADLSKIKLVCKEGMWSDSGSSKRSS